MTPRHTDKHLNFPPPPTPHHLLHRVLSLAEANGGSTPVVMLALRLLANLPKHMGTRCVLCCLMDCA